MGYLNQVGLLSISAKFQLSSWFRSDQLGMANWVILIR